MTDFSAQLKQFGDKTRSNVGQVHTIVTARVYDELVHGGQLSGAPGQPDDIRDTFEISRNVLVSTIATGDRSALSVERGVNRFNGNPIRLKSPIGGFHSRALILAAGQAIVDHAAREVKGNG